MFCGVKFGKNADPVKYSYSGYGIGFDSCSLFSDPVFDWGKNDIIFRVDNSSSVHTSNKKRDISVLGGGPTQDLDATTIMAETKCSSDFSRSYILFKPAL